MAQKGCKCEEEECEECPEWIFTLADLIMCMMGLFVLLWVLKPAPGPKQMESNDDWIKVVAKIREAFDYLPDPQSKDPVDIYMLLNKLDKMQPLNNPGPGGKIPRENPGARGKDEEVTSIRLGKQVVVGSRMIFAPAGAQLNDETRTALDEIAQRIRGHRNITVVKGHTALDDFAETASAQKRMALSVDRAQAVADYLTTKGVDPSILRVQGCSTFEPVILRTYTPEAQMLNRRAEVEVTGTLADELKGNPDTATTQPESASPAKH